MKRILRVLVIMTLFMSCSLLNKQDAKYRPYKLEATIVTNKGDINAFLYPNAAPETVANFVFLSENGFYNNLSFHRVDEVVVQGGDPLANGRGGSGYTIKDEFDGFLKFNYSGMLAMANAGPNTSSSQFFITKMALPTLNGSYTAFGSLKTLDDLIIVKSLEPNDKIIEIKISGENKEGFLDLFSDKVSEWKSQLRK